MQALWLHFTYFMENPFCFPTSCSPALSGKASFSNRSEKAPLRGHAPRGGRLSRPGAGCLAARRVPLSFRRTLVRLIWKDLFSQHTLVFQGQNLLSGPARAAWAAEDKGDKLARREWTWVLERRRRAWPSLGGSTGRGTALSQITAY